MSRRRSKVCNQKGFTLIEIIAVLVILGILAAVAIPRFMDLTTVASDKAAMQAVAEGKSRLSNQFARNLLIGNRQTPRVHLITKATASLTDAGDYRLTYEAAGTANEIRVRATGVAARGVKGTNVKQLDHTAITAFARVFSNTDRWTGAAPPSRPFVASIFLSGMRRSAGPLPWCRDGDCGFVPVVKYRNEAVTRLCLCPFSEGVYPDRAYCDSRHPRGSRLYCRSQILRYHAGGPEPCGPSGRDGGQGPSLHKLCQALPGKRDAAGRRQPRRCRRRHDKCGRLHPEFFNRGGYVGHQNQCLGQSPAYRAPTAACGCCRNSVALSRCRARDPFPIISSRANSLLISLRMIRPSIPGFTS